MTTSELLLESFSRLKRFRLLILVAGVAGGLLLFFYAKSKRPVFTAKATIFPLSNALDNSLSSNTLSGILALGDAPKSFSSDAAINIIELTLSRFVREAVAATRLPEFGNKRIAELLIGEINEHTPLFSGSIKVPTDSIGLVVLGGELLKPEIVAKMSKNNVLELYFSNTNKKLVSPVSYVLIDKLSQFYIDLKIKKARADYEFTVKKIDSLDEIIAGVDKKAIRIQNSTLFAPDRLEYEIPRDRVSSDKQRFVRQRDISLNNQEEALWRLQKLTPIIAVLDKPTEPFTVAQPSLITYSAIGLIGGCILSVFFLLAGLISRFAKSELRKSLLEPTPPTIS